MAFKTASVTLDGSNLRFISRTGSGHSIVLDDGRGDTGPRPAELIPVALAACTAMDVISILRKKRQQVTRYEVRADGVQIKIEVTPVLRGCVFEPELRAVSAAVEREFGFAEANVVSFPDLYAGKIVAALDRQHPRDLFDVRDLLAAEGIDDALRQAFIVYLLSHDRPMSEVLAPTRKGIADEFARRFDGMTAEAVSHDELVAVREALIADIVGKMPSAHRRFLVSFERGEPDWALLAVPCAPDLPAVKWRQQNLDKLSATKRAELVARLEEVLKE